MIKTLTLKQCNKVMKYVSIILVVISVFSFFVLTAKVFLKDNNSIAQFFFNLDFTVNSFFAVVISAATVYSLAKKNKEISALFGGIYFIAFESVFNSITNASSAFLLAILISSFISFVFNYFENFKETIFLNFLVALLLGVLLGYSYNLFLSYSLDVAEYASKSFFAPFLFNFFNQISGLFVNSTYFSKLFFEKSLGGALFVQDNFVTGVKNIFEYQIINNLEISTFSSKFLAGNFITSAFVVMGFIFSLLPFLRKKPYRLKILFIIGVVSVLTGSTNIFLIMLFLFNPIFPLIFILISSISYQLCYVLNFNFGFLESGGIIEFIKFIEHYKMFTILLFLLTGAIISVFSYSVMKLSIKKFKISSNYSYALISNDFVKNLGGIRNLKKIVTKGNNISIYLNNCNLIDNIVFSKYNCDLLENKIVFKFTSRKKYDSFYKSVSLLSEYI